MENYFSNLPAWVSLLFIPTFPITIYIISQIIKRGGIDAGLSQKQVNNIQLSIWGFFTIYLFYTFILSTTGLLSENTLPPRVLLFTAIPLLLVLLGFIFNKPLYWKILDKIPLESLIKIHIFRFVGVFFLIGVYYETLPVHFALIAGFGDIVTAIGAIFVSRWVTEKKSWRKKATLIWNIFGFWDIVSVIISAILTTKNSLENNTQSVIEITKLPFVWIPAFAPAVIIFLHISVFKKLKRDASI
jgi:hypothetical protein